MKYTLDEFKNVWNGNSANDILNQFYYEHIELQKALEKIANLQIDKSQLTNNWNELEEYIENEWKVVAESPDGSFYDGYDTCMEEMKKDILDKMKEIEKRYEKQDN